MAAKKNEKYPLRIESYGSSGEGVARLDGQAVFVKGALEGELCSVQLLKVGKSAAWGRVDKVLEPSPARQESDCPQYPKCGGCQLRVVARWWCGKFHSTPPDIHAPSIPMSAGFMTCWR